MSNQDNDDLIHRFLLGLADEDDKQKISDWINSNPANQQYFVQLRDAWLLVKSQVDLQNVDLETEWLDLQRSFPSIMKVVGTDVEKTEPEHDDDVRPPVKKMSFIKQLAIVATVAAALYLLFAYPFNSSLNTTPAITRNNKVETNNAAPTARKVSNNTGREMKIELPDGSTVVIQNKGEISYDADYNSIARNIKIIGDAEFSVMKDSSRPFTVLTDYISTTAMGTRFQVKSVPSQHLDIVRLFEGKVLVKGLNAGSKVKLVLKPGDELVFNRQNLTARIISFNKKRKPGKKSSEPEIVSAPSDYKGSWFMFNNEPLENVFRQLERMYQVKIRYEKKDLANIFFVGKFDLNESIENIINRISIVNHLKYKREKETFIISK